MLKKNIRFQDKENGKNIMFRFKLGIFIFYIYFVFYYLKLKQ